MLERPWTGPYGGVPPLDLVQVAHFEPALEAAMAEHRAEVEAIASQVETPTFANTVEALERAGSTLDRVRSVYGLFCSNHSSPELRQVRKRMAPRLAAHRDAIHQEPRIIERLKPLLADRSSLTTEQDRLLDVIRNRFVRGGANLDAPGRQRLTAINSELSTLYTRFDDNLLADEEKVIVFLDEADLDGLSVAWRGGAAVAAEERGQPGRWAVLNTRSSAQPFLESSDRRDLREKVWRAFTSRGDNGDANDNNAIVTRILALRTERARLLGYPTSSHMLLDESMAGTPEAVQALLDRIWPAARAKYRAECDAMSEWARANGHDPELKPWDVRYYAEKVRAERHALDSEKLSAYLQLHRLRDGLFWMAERFLGWKLTPVDDVPLPHPDVSAYKVEDADGVRGIWVFDPYARVGKRSGAWMTAWRVQQQLDGRVLPLVSNNENYVKAPPGQPTLLSWDDAQTLFHEFGHAMHGLASNVRYPSLAGTGVCRDFVEFPSQLAEHWLATPELLARFARNAADEPLPEAWLGALKAAENASSGFTTVEFMACALVDLALHLETEPVDPRAYEKQALERIGMPDTLCMRHRLPHFSHLFSSDGYASAYYSYLWADVLVADAAEAFADAGFYDADLARRYHDTVLSRGNTVDPADAFRAFRGRDPEPEALFRDRGFTS